MKTKRVKTTVLIAILIIANGIISSCTTPSRLSTELRVPAVSIEQQPKSLLKAAAKNASQEAKKLKKEGYYTEPMALPMDVQLTKAYIYESALDDEGVKSFFTERASVKSRSKSAGKQHATEVCMIYLARSFNAHIAGLAQTDLSNHELSQAEAESISKTVSAYENWTAINLGPVIPVAVFMKDEKDGIVEVSVSVAYNLDANLDRLREETISKLQKDTDVAREKLESLMAPERFNNINLK